MKSERISPFWVGGYRPFSAAMGVNADATTLIKLMDIGTPTNVSQAQ